MRLERIYKNVWIANLTGTIQLGNDIHSGNVPAEDVGILTVCEDDCYYKAKAEFGQGLEAIPSRVLHIIAGLNDGPPNHNDPYGEPNEQWRYDGAVKSLAFMAEIKEMVVVHCWGGTSRSSFVIAAYIASMEDMTIEDAIKYIQTKYPHAHPHPKHLQDYSGVS